MSRLVLELRERGTGRVDMGGVTPDRLQGMSPSQIAALEVPVGRERRRLDELFALAGNDPQEILLGGPTDCLDRVGAGMRSGRIIVEGKAGDYLGQGMRGGEILARGDAGAYAAAGLRDGRVCIAGNAGDFLGAAICGEPHGMRGGTVYVRGSAGDRAGDRLRRGQILVEGDAGDYPGARMLAGTIAVLGQAGRYAGFGMRRGTLLFAKPPTSLPASFNETGRHNLSFLTLFIRSLRHLEGAFAELDPLRTSVLRFVGDLGCAGRGEVLVWL